MTKTVVTGHTSVGIANIPRKGLVTTWGIATSARDAFCRGYFVYALADCGNTYNDELQNFSMNNILPNCGAVSDSTAFIDTVN